MKIISSVLFFILFTTALGQSSESTNTVTSRSTSSVSTTEVPTTSDKTTPTTLEPTTTTVESTTITDASTTTAPTTTSSSTTVPSTTSSPVPPTKSPEPQLCKFNVTEGNVTCIRAEMEAKFAIHAENTTYIIVDCDSASARGNCSSNETQTLVLSESTYTLTMIFAKDSGKVFVSNVTFDYNVPELPRGSGTNHSSDLFSVKAGNSYKCKSKFDIKLDNITMEVQDVHIQAFIEEGKGYGAIQECDADEKVSDIVPIAVGVALAALIIIVLIAYLVGRRRSRQKGYQSV